LIVRVFKSVWQHYTPTPEIHWLLEQFRQMLNDCIRIGLTENVTSLKSLSLKAYKQLSRYDVASYYKLCAISAATGILRNYWKAKRKGRDVKEPYARRLHLTTCYGFKVRDGELSLPIRAKEHVRISLNQHVQATINGFTLRSVTLTEDRLSIAYANEVQQLQPRGLIGIDRNLDNVTIAATDGTVQQHGLSEATRAKAVYRDVRSHFRRNDVRIRREISGKYGRKQRDKVKQILHHVSKLIVEEAKAKQYGIAMEKLTGIRRLYRRGNWQGRWYRGRMNSWSYAELQNQIEYKAKWEGLKVIYVHPHGTSSKCSICGQKMKPEENRTLRCPSCGYTVDRDVNAAKNILAAGTLRFGVVGLAGEAMVAEPAPLQQSAKSMRGS
jgi:putative transposase